MSFLPEPLRMLVTNPRIRDLSSDGPIAYALRQKVTGNLSLPKDLSLAGKTILVTGATSGVGLEASRQLLQLGANLIIGARSLQRAEAVRADFFKSLPDASSRLAIYELDMESLASVDRFIDRISADGIVFDVVLLNAGVFSRSGRGDITKTQAPDPLDPPTPHLMQVNFRATAYLALRLLPVIRQLGRLVLVTSEAHAWSAYQQPPPPRPAKILDGLDKVAPVGDADEEYYAAKLFLALFGRELARRTDPEKLTTVLTTPGFCASGFFREGESVMTKIIYATSARSSAQGARLHLHAMTAPTGPDTFQSGSYLRDGATAQLSKFAESDEGRLLQVRLWEEMTELVEKRGAVVSLNDLVA
ncbi:hypothetical protein QBC44DRAFT_322700 [Cladorrhinum sp. PSN332]|nr:hypothetical protein QBC44DRAFT_322700 [Cladorrhinum sp. PSN332]